MISFFPLTLKAQVSAQEDCDFDNADGRVYTRLTIGQNQETIRYADCTVTPLTVDVTTPEQGSGSLEVCVDLQGPSSLSASRYFEVIDAGNFTLQSVSSVGTMTYCQTITYPNPAEEFEDLPIQRLYMSLIGGVDDDGDPVIQGSRATTTDIASGLSCTTPAISTAFTSIGIRLDDGSVGTRVTDGTTPVTLSQIEDDLLTYRFPSPALAPTRETVAILEGTLIIDEDYDFGGSSTGTERNELVLFPGASIEIASGANVNLSRLDIRGCKAMYDGIIVKDGATLTVDDVTIQDGEHAFQVEDGGSLTVRESNFDNNHVSIAVLKTGSTGKSVEINSIGNHFGFDYRSDFGAGVGITDPLPALLPPYAGENPAAAADFNEVTAGIVFMNSPTRGENVIEFHQNGITLDESSMTISGTRFQDIESITPKAQTGYGVLSKPNSSGSYRRRPVKVFQNDLSVAASKVTFERMNVAIGTFNDSPLRIFDILADEVNTGVYLFGYSFLRLKDSDITAAHYGVNKVGSIVGFRDDTRVTDNILKVTGDNTFDGSPTVVRYFNSQPGQLSIVDHTIKDNDIILDGAEYGVRVVSSTDVRVEDNHVTWDSDQFATYGISFEGVERSEVQDNLIEGFLSPNFSEATAIRVLGGDRTRVGCNTVDKVETGTLFFGSNNETDYRGNNYFELGLGLQLGINLPVDPTFIGPQVHRGNEWIGPFTSTDEAVYYNDSNDDSNLSLSSFTVFDGLKSEYLPTTNVSPPFDWFFNTSSNSNTTYECNNPVPTSEPLNPLAEQVFANTYQPDSEWSGMKWLARYKTTKAIADGRITSNDYPGRNSWMQTGAYALANAYFQVEDDIRNVANMSQGEEVWLTTTDAQNIADQDIYADNSVAKFLDAQNYTSSMEQSRQQALSRLVQAEADNQPVYTTLDNNMMNNAQSVASAAASLPVQNLAQQFSKTLDSISLAIMLNSTNRWTDFTTQVITIATACPLQGGEAVFKARGIAEVLGLPIPVDSYQNCLPAPEPKSAKRKKRENLSFNVFPNPSNGQFKISYPSDEYGVNIVEIYDTRGVLIYSFDPSESFGEVISIDARPARLSSGVYQLRLRTSLGKKISRTLIIQL